MTETDSETNESEEQRQISVSESETLLKVRSQRTAFESQTESASGLAVYPCTAAVY